MHRSLVFTSLFLISFCFLLLQTNNVKEEFELNGLCAESFCKDVRSFQQRSKCSDATCADIVRTIGKYLNFQVPDVHEYDKKLQEEAGTSFLRLNGCPSCHKHVYMPTDRATHCPTIKSDGTVCGHPRYDDAGKPFEVFVFFSCLQ